MPRDARIDEAVQGPVVATVVCFILARVALALFGGGRLTAGQKLLLYPALVAVYVPVTAVLLLGPVALSGLFAIKTFSQFDHEREDLEGERAYLGNWIEKDSKELRQAKTPGKATSRPVDEIKKDLATRVSQREAIEWKLKRYPSCPILWNTGPPTPVVVTYGLIAVAGATWFLVGLFSTLFPGVVRHVFQPFADGFSRQMGFGLTVLGLLMSLGGLVILLYPSSIVDQDKGKDKARKGGCPLFNGLQKSAQANWRFVSPNLARKRVFHEQHLESASRFWPRLASLSPLRFSS